ncbi:MAG TPA: hypothetical protein VGQ37_14610 [Vicinamibacterales bacterium]|jgi:hypothetical protein|nr:hypothetical protein [Vicinamibacterales bacterium]
MVLLNIAWVLLRIMVVAQVIHTHPVVGSTAFWPTRPIPPLLLLRAKVVLLAVTLIVVPVAAEALLMAAYGVTFGELLRVAAETALFATLWLALLALPAVLTRTFSRFTLVCCGVLAALALYVAVSITISSIAPPSAPPTPQLVTAVDSTGLFVFVTGLIVACGLTLTAQYRWRRAGRSAGIVVASVVAAVIVADRWPWPVLRAEPELPSWATVSSLSLSADAEAMRTFSMTRNNDQAWKGTVGAIEVGPLPSGWSAETALLEATLEIGGRRLTSASEPFLTPAAASDGSSLARNVVIQRLLGAVRLTTETPPGPPRGQLLVIPEDEFQRYQPARGQYRGRHYVQLVHHTAEAVVPLRPGAAAARGSYHLNVAAVMLSNRSARVRVRESNASSRLDRRVPPEREFFAVNRRTGDAYALGQGAAPIGLLPRMFNGVSLGQTPGDPGFVTRVLDLQFPLPWQGAAGEPITREWLANAELIAVISTREGALELPLVAPDFRLDETADR